MDLEAVIGLEIHVQMNTKTKMFCTCDNDSFGKTPNSNVCPVCMGFPGQLPVLNEKALEKGIIAGLALECKIPEFSKFDRKQYFYPDNPKGFQISQYDKPLAINGKVNIPVDDKEYTIRVNRLHIEDDAGKLVHRDGATFLDFNRAGTPLMEIVSEPDLRSAKQARVYAESIRDIMRYCDSSNCDMEKGMMRFDASVSLRPVGEDKLYPRTEIKNLNSFRFLEEAINYEINRQAELWQEGKPPTKQITAGWVEEKGKTEVLRDKEDAADYRYFPEPDLPPIRLKKEYINDLKKYIPELPNAKFERYIKELGLKNDDAYIISRDKDISGYFERVGEVSGNYEAAANWINSVLGGYMNEYHVNFEDLKVTAQSLGRLIKMIDSGKISSKIAKEVFLDMFDTGEDSEDIVIKKGLKQISDHGQVESFCDQIIKSFPEVVEDIRGGKDKAIGRLVGEVMKLSKGQANPGLVNQILKSKIEQDS